LQTELECKRYLLRLWLAPPDAQGLHAAMAERFGSVIIGDRRGISGARLHALQAVV
jgi:hypothetical protein